MYELTRSLACRFVFLCHCHLSPAYPFEPLQENLVVMNPDMHVSSQDQLPLHPELANQYKLVQCNKSVDEVS